MNDNEVELLHYSNYCVCSWYDCAHFIIGMAIVQMKLNPITIAQYPTPAQRPHFSVLCKEKIKGKYGIESKHWSTSLEIFLSME
jgi:dTDP-4-dehydrorhamnose reductase